MVTRRYSLIYAALLAVGAMTSSCRQAVEEPKMHLTIGGPQNLAMLVMLAQDRGYFAKHGVDVTYQPLQNGKISFDAVAAGQIDLGLLVDANLAFIGFEGQRGVVAIASVMEKTDDAIVARADRNIRQPTDLTGRRVAYLPGTSSHVFLLRFAEKNKLDLSKVQLIAMSPPAMQAALTTGAVDAITVWQPFRSNAMATLGKAGMQFDNGGIYRARVLLTARNDRLKTRSEAARRVLDSLDEAASFARTNPNKAIPILAKQLGVNEKSLAGSWSEYNLAVTFPSDLSFSLGEIGKQVVQTEPKFRSRPVPDYAAFWEPLASASVKP